MLADLDWTTNREAYGAMLHEAGQSNLLQSWAWGEAKAEVEGWRARRGVLSVGALVLAAVQVLEKRVGPARVLRVNRGPVWLRDDLSAEARLAVMGRLRSLGRWWKGSALLLAAELPEGHDLSPLGFRPRSAPLWRSAWVDLGRDGAELRKGLAGKWRNMLVNAEKAELTTEVVSGPEGVAWLLPRYRDMMSEKGFAATPPELLTALARHADADDVLTLVARKDGEEASAVLLVRHGAAATYLVGWNADLGRQVRGNHLLLWRSMLELKERGTRWFDLGGIDDVLTPGIAAFKRGLKGEDYALNGEWLAI